MRKIGLFGGTFDPIHFGHIHLALSLQEQKGLNEVWFSPNQYSPLKEKEACRASSLHRLHMVKLGLEELKDSFRVLEYEALQQGPSYTIDLLRFVRKHLCQPGDLVYLLLGEDAALTFAKWHKAEEIVQLATLLVGTRTCQGQASHGMFPWESVSIPSLQISSSDIRKRLKLQQYCGHLVPKSVLDYINTNKLYC